VVPSDAEQVLREQMENGVCYDYVSGEHKRERGKKGGGRGKDTLKVLNVWMISKVKVSIPTGESARQAVCVLPMGPAGYCRDH
jgi:hypothetical protein